MNEMKRGDEMNLTPFTWKVLIFLVLVATFGPFFLAWISS